MCIHNGHSQKLGKLQKSPKTQVSVRFPMEGHTLRPNVFNYSQRKQVLLQKAKLLK